MKTVFVTVGTRPEAIKLAPVVQRLRERPDQFRTVLCLTGQHRSLVDEVIAMWGLSVDHDLDVMTHGQSVVGVASRVLADLPALLTAERPDVMLVQGDTVSATAGALAAFYLGIPVAHVEAGLRTGVLHEPFPEEGNRKLIAAISSVHYAPTAWAADNLRAENVPDADIVVTGNTGIDAFRQISAQVPEAVPAALAGIDTGGRHLVLLTVHRRENQMHHLDQICNAVEKVAAEGDVHLLYPVHPAPTVRAVVVPRLSGLPNVTLVEPMDYLSIAWVLNRCRLVLTDSGGLQEEGAAAGRPVLVLRRTTDRPEAVHAGCAVLVGSDPEDILSWTRQLVRDDVTYEALSKATAVYGDGHAAERIAEHLAATTFSTHHAAVLSDAETGTGSRKPLRP